MRTEYLKNIGRYYTDKLSQHGATAKGVDWKDEPSQLLRFEKLAEVIETQDPFSILDYGCGFGSLLTFLRERYSKFDYTGYDVSANMIREAESQNPAGPVGWITERNELAVYDYIIASGVFNVKLDFQIRGWEEYILGEIDWLNEHSSRGFAFNMLTSYSDVDHMREDLFYGDPLKIFDHCKRKYSKFVSLLHDYPLYEFTIIVRKL